MRNTIYDKGDFPQLWGERLINPVHKNAQVILLQSGLISSVGRVLASKLRGPGFKSRPGTVGGPVTIIIWGARPCWKLALS